MGLNGERLTAVKRYMRIDGDEDDEVIAALYAAAVRYLSSAGVYEPPDCAELYHLAVWSLTLHYYDHRDAVGGEASIPTGLRPIINQLKLTGGDGSVGM